MFSSVGLGLSNFLVGDEIVFKADWGVPQFFDGVNNKLYWNPEAKIVLEPQLDGMKRAEIIDWIAGCWLVWRISSYGRYRILSWIYFNWS